MTCDNEQVPISLDFNAIASVSSELESAKLTIACFLPQFHDLIKENRSWLASSSSFVSALSHKDKKPSSDAMMKPLLKPNIHVTLAVVIVSDSLPRPNSIY